MAFESASANSEGSEEMGFNVMPATITTEHYYAAMNPWMQGFPREKVPKGFAAVYVRDQVDPPDEYWLQLTNGLWIVFSHYRKGRYMPILAFELPSNMCPVRYKIGNYNSYVPESFLFDILKTTKQKLREKWESDDVLEMGWNVASKKTTTNFRGFQYGTEDYCCDVATVEFKRKIMNAIMDIRLCDRVRALIAEWVGFPIWMVNQEKELKAEIVWTDDYDREYDCQKWKHYEI